MRDIEIATRVPKKFRFPMFQRLVPEVFGFFTKERSFEHSRLNRICWYVAEGYVRLLKTKEQPIPQRVLEGLVELMDFLMSEVRLIEGVGNDVGRKEAREMVPGDKVKDPGALARELRWRLRVAVDGESGDEGGLRSRSGAATKHTTSRKRKRTASERLDDGLLVSRESSTAASDIARSSMFRNFTPKPWDSVNTTKGNVVRSFGEKAPVDFGFETGTMESRADAVVKLRKLGDGRMVEREIVTRVREVWKADLVNGS